MLSSYFNNCLLVSSISALDAKVPCCHTGEVETVERCAKVLLHGDMKSLFGPNGGCPRFVESRIVWFRNCVVVGYQFFPISAGLEAN